MLKPKWQVLVLVWFHGYRKIGSSFGFSFAYAQLRFLGFSFGLSFIKDSYFILNRDYLNTLTYWRFCFITMISSGLDGRVRRAIASKFVDLGIILSPVTQKTQKLVFTAFLPDAQR